MYSKSSAFSIINTLLFLVSLFTKFFKEKTVNKYNFTVLRCYLHCAYLLNAIIRWGRFTLGYFSTWRNYSLA